MKKVKLVIPIIAIVIGTVTAWASRQQQGCMLLTQYYYNGSGYSPAGVLGTDYVCSSGNSICTYYHIGNSYASCQSGIYTPLHARSLKK